MKIKKRNKNKKFNEFFEFFVNSVESKTAFSNGTISTDLKSIKKSTLKSSLNKTNEIKERNEINEIKSENEVNLNPFKDLLSKQSSDGRWYSLEEVFQSISLIYENKRYFNNLEEWEEATIFALAKIRQRCDLFHILGNAHDKAMTWITTTNLIKKATEIIANLELQQQSQLQSQSQISSRPNSRSLTSPKKKITFDVPTDPYRKLLEQSSRMNYSRTMSAKLTESQEINNSEQLIEAQIEEQRKKLAMSLLNPAVQYDVFLTKILEVHQNIENYEKNILQLLIQLDQLRKEVLDCINRCTVRYNESILQSERNASFDELTATLGDDLPPRPGADDWRKYGKKGFRTCVCKLLNSLHFRAIEKQRLRSLLGIMSGVDWTHVDDPSSQQLSELVNELSPGYLHIVNTKDDWTMRWSGKEIGKYILQSLDFMNKSTLLIKWYGTSYPFKSNPFSFSFHIEQLWSEVCNDEMVSQYVHRYAEKIRSETKSLVSSNVMTVTFEQEEVDMNTKWQFEERLYRDQVIDTQAYFQNVTEGIPNWWPKPPEVADIKYVDNLLVSFLVLRLLIRSNEDEAQGKLAAALTRGGIRSKKKLKSQTGTETEINSKELERINSTESIKGRSNQQPHDYKAWLFTDDWYTHYGPIQNQPSKKGSKQTSPRQISTSQSDNTQGLATYRQNSTAGNSTYPSPITEKKPSFEKSFSNVSSRSINSPKIKPKNNKEKVESKETDIKNLIQPPPSREASKVDSKAKITFQEQVYDLMAKDKDSIENSLNETSGSLIISSTLTDDDDDLISVSEIKTRSNIMSIEEEHSIITEANFHQQLPDTSNHIQDQNFDELSSHSGGTNRENNQDNHNLKNNQNNNRDNDTYDEDDDYDDDPDELKSIEENTQLVTDKDKHDIRHRLSTVSIPVDINGLEAVPKDAYKHIDSRQTMIPILQEENTKITKKDSRVKVRQTTIDSPQKSSNTNKTGKKRGNTQRLTQGEFKNNNIQISSTSNILSNDQEQTKIQNQSPGKTKLMKLKNSRLLLAVSAFKESSSSKNKSIGSPNKEDQNKSSTSGVSTQTKPKLTLKEIKERRKETLPARLKAAGLDQTFLPQQKTKSTTSLSSSTSQLPQQSSSLLPVISQSELNNKKSKVTRIKLLSRENSIKLTRRVNENNDL